MSCATAFPPATLFITKIIEKLNKAEAKLH